MLRFLSPIFHIWKRRQMLHNDRCADKQSNTVSQRHKKAEFVNKHRKFLHWPNTVVLKNSSPILQKQIHNVDIQDVLLLYH